LPEINGRPEISVSLAGRPELALYRQKKTERGRTRKRRTGEGDLRSGESGSLEGPPGNSWDSRKDWNGSYGAWPVMTAWIRKWQERQHWILKLPVGKPLVRMEVVWKLLVWTLQ
jgi:hypothetical protein